MRSAKHGADYITFICNVPREFTPRLNHEHSERKIRTVGAIRRLA
jgi:hypothetical protein